MLNVNLLPFLLLGFVFLIGCSPYSVEGNLVSSPSSQEVEETREVVGTIVITSPGIEVNACCPGGGHTVGTDFEWSQNGEGILLGDSLINITHFIQDEESITRGGLQGAIYSPTLSPDNHTVAYASYLPSDPEGNSFDLPPLSVRAIYLTGENDTPQLIHTVAPPYWIFALEWSPKGDQIAIQIVEGNDNVRLYILNINDSSFVTLVDSVGVESFQWHPSGESIAFIGKSENPSNEQPQYDFEIYLADIRTQSWEQITNIGPCIGSPAWSPDGTRLAFAGIQDSNNEIFVFNGQTKEMINVTNSKGHDSSPSWSPDGQQVIYTSFDDSGEKTQEICVVNVAGSSHSCLTHTPDIDEDKAQWSPDGQWIAFFAEDQASTNLIIMRPDGSEQFSLITLPDN